MLLFIFQVVFGLKTPPCVVGIIFNSISNQIIIVYFSAKSISIHPAVVALRNIFDFIEINFWQFNFIHAVRRDIFSALLDVTLMFIFDQYTI